jgi:hypothetical protein
VVRFGGPWWFRACSEQALSIENLSGKVLGPRPKLLTVLDKLPEHSKLIFT